MKDSSISVVKFGGSSFATPERFGPVVEWVAALAAQRPVVCVVSAPSGSTERFRDELLSFNAAPTDRLVDAGLPLADSFGAVLVASALQAGGLNTAVALGNQTGLRSDRNPMRARLLDVDLTPLRRLLSEHRVVVVPGGQASSIETGETTWLGKNSSDLSAVALAAGFGCAEVAIHSDVPGVFTSDPAIVEASYVLRQLSHQQAIAMSLSGAKVLHHRAVEYALERGLRIVCRANQGNFEIGTVLEVDGSEHPVIVPDLRSQVFIGDTDAVAEGTTQLAGVDVPHFSMPGSSANTRRLVVTCGFFEAQQFLLERHQLALHAEPSKLLSVLGVGAQPLREFVSQERMRERAACLHQQHCEAVTRVRLPAFKAATLGCQHV